MVSAPSVSSWRITFLHVSASAFRGKVESNWLHLLIPFADSFGFAVMNILVPLVTLVQWHRRTLLLTLPILTTTMTLGVVAVNGTRQSTVTPR